MKTDRQKRTLLVIQTSTNVRQPENQEKGILRCTWRKVLLAAAAFILAGFIQASAADATGGSANVVSSTPVLSGRMLPSGFQLEVTGGTGSYTLQSSADPSFRDPQLVTNFEAGANTLQFVDPRGTQGPALYYRIVANASGNAVNQPSGTNDPTIVLQPQSTGVMIGSPATFSVTASGTTPLSYQWFKDITNSISGATSNVYVINSVSSQDAGIYRVQVANSVGCILSSNATLTVLVATNQPPSTNQPPVTNQAPVIVFQPQSTNVMIGSPATFRVTATGTAPLSYQWFKDITNSISGATSNNFVISSVSPSDAGLYRVQVSNPAGSALSANATLTVLAATNQPPSTNQPPVTNQAPVIVTQPQSTSVVLGSVATFHVTATGITPLSYQWFKDVTNSISGATSNVYVIGSVSSSDAGIYRVQVSNPAGSVLSANATLTVFAATNQPPSTNQPPVTNQAPVIVFQPQSTNVMIGSPATFRVTATGTAPLSYQWFKDITNSISGATSNNYVISSVSSSDAGLYRVQVTNPAGSVLSANATLTVLAATNQPPSTNQPPVTNQAPAIVTQPQSTSVVLGSVATFHVTATGITPLSYQWFKDITNSITGATSNVYVINSVSSSDAGLYRVQVTNPAGSVLSANATLTVLVATNQPPSTNQPPVTNQAPVIVTQPQSTSVVLGGVATFHVTATGITPLSYQWFKNITNSISGATSNVYVINSVSSQDAGIYRVQVTNPAGSVLSANATLTVLAVTNQPPSTNQPPATNQAPVIVTQPQSTSVVVGSTATFSVMASGIIPLSYQWFKNITNSISGATSNVYVINSVSSQDAGIYRVQVTNPTGSVWSVNATLTVLAATNQPPSTNQAPVIVTQPQSASVVLGGTAAFSVTATGITPLSYQWFKNITNSISGATSNVYVINSVSSQDAGVYRVLVTNPAGSVWSANATLAVFAATNQPPSTNQPPVTNQAPVIVTQPQSTSVIVGGTAAFSVTTTGITPLSYQWFKNITNSINGATSNVYVINSVSSQDAGIYRVQVTNPAGSVLSANATLTVLAATNQPPSTNQPPATNQAPVIVTQPQSTSVVVGSTATFSVMASGIIPLSYQWFKNITNSISGATSNNYVISSVSSSDAGLYRVQVTNPAGSVLSANATLTVLAAIVSKD